MALAIVGGAAERGADGGVSRLGLYGATRWLVAILPGAAVGSGMSLDQAANKVVILYSHGTYRPSLREDCQKGFNQIPESILGLSRHPKVAIFYLCTKVVDTSNQGQYVYQRAQEIRQTLDALTALGVKPEHIVLAGHSAGAWSSLLLMGEQRRQFAGAILFAPAFAGTIRERRGTPWGDFRTAQVKKIKAFPALQALVFAYENDPYETPATLAFLRAASGVDFHAYDCHLSHPHLTHLEDCQAERTRSLVEAYVTSKVGMPLD